MTDSCYDSLPSLSAGGRQGGGLSYRLYPDTEVKDDHRKTPITIAHGLFGSKQLFDDVSRQLSDDGRKVRSTCRQSGVPLLVLVSSPSSPLLGRARGEERRRKSEGLSPPHEGVTPSLFNLCFTVFGIVVTLKRHFTYPCNLLHLQSFSSRC